VRPVGFVLDAGAGRRWEVAAWLSVPRRRVADVLQILVHGSCSSHWYWDFPFEPDRYSYVWWSHRSGLPPLNLDRPGAGASAETRGIETTIEAQAAALHSLVGEIGRGALGTSFDSIVLVGHSLGSIVCGYEAATYDDVDRVVLTGVTGTASRVHDDDPRAAAN